MDKENREANTNHGAQTMEYKTYLQKETGLKQSTQVTILCLSLDLIPSLHKDKGGRRIVSKLIIRGGFDGSENPITFEYYGSCKPRYSRRWYPGAAISKTDIYDSPKDCLKAFNAWKVEAQETLKKTTV